MGVFSQCAAIVPLIAEEPRLVSHAKMDFVFDAVLMNGDGIGALIASHLG
jgi:hypothetical protein